MEYCKNSLKPKSNIWTKVFSMEFRLNAWTKMFSLKVMLKILTKLFSLKLSLNTFVWIFNLIPCLLVHRKVFNMEFRLNTWKKFHVETCVENLNKSIQLQVEFAHFCLNIQPKPWCACSKKSIQHEVQDECFLENPRLQSEPLNYKVHPFFW